MKNINSIILGWDEKCQKEYFNRIKERQTEPEIGDFGFFTQAIKQLRTNSS